MSDNILDHYIKGAITDLDGAIIERECLHFDNIPVVLTNGCFDILHRGHLEFLNNAAKFGKLFVLLNSDKSVKTLKGDHRPINNEQDRAYALASLTCVYHVVIFDSSTCENEILQLHPDFYVKGGDYIAGLNQEEKNALDTVKCEIKILDFKEGYSTTSIIEKIIKLNKS